MVSTEVVPDVKSPTCFKRTVKPNILSFFTHVIQNELKTGFFHTVTMRLSHFKKGIKA